MVNLLVWFGVVWVQLAWKGAAISLLDEGVNLTKKAIDLIMWERRFGLSI